MPEDRTDYHEWALTRTRALLARGPAQRLVGVMVSSIDARATLNGKSGGLSSAPDRALLKAWRAAAGGVLVGARTLETERYGSLIPEADRDARVAAGQPGWPRLLTISRRGDIDLDAVLATDPALPLTVYAEADAPGADGLAGAGPNVEVVTLPAASPVAVVADARARYGYDVIGCEGGPHLLVAALAAGVLTDLSLTVAPAILGGGIALLPGDALAGGVALELLDAEAHAGSIFAHYLVR